MSEASRIMPVEEMSDRALVKRFLDVCNCAIEENANKFPFKQMLALSNCFLGGRPITVGIYKDDPSKTYDHYTYRFENSRFSLMEHGKVHDAFEWRTCRGYLEKVVKNPREYIENPNQLKFDWLKGRLGLKLD